MRSPSPLLLALALAATACVDSDLDADPGDDDFGTLVGLDEKSDGFAAQVELVGELDYGETAGNIAYVGAPRYRAVRFRATMGDRVEVTVRAVAASPLVWILDERFEIVSQGQENIVDGADRTGVVRHDVPFGVDRAFYVMMRSAYLEPTELTVTIEGALPEPGCDEDNHLEREVRPEDAPMPRAALSYMRASGWGCMHREWHDVRLLDVLIGPEQIYVENYHPEWTRVDPQEGAAGNGVDFLAMHRVMLSMMREQFPSWASEDTYADLRGWARGEVPTDPMDADWPVPAGNRPWFDRRQLTALENLETRLEEGFESDGELIDTDDELGRYIQTKRRPVPGTPWALSTDFTTGIHNYMHGRFNDAQSPIRMGNFARNIEGRVFWRLHGWIDEVWTRFRLAHRPPDAEDGAYLAEMAEACTAMMAAHGHGSHPHRWDVETGRCVHQ